MRTLPTAEEFLVRDEKFLHPLTQKEKEIYIESIITHEDYVKDMIEFAKLHCIEQAKVISEKAEMKLCCDTPETEYICKDSILNAYSLDLIK